MTTTPATEPIAAAAPPASGADTARRSVPGLVLDLFSNVKFGIWILVILFIYMSVGSAGIVYPTPANLLHPDA